MTINYSLEFFSAMSPYNSIQYKYQIRLYKTQFCKLIILLTVLKLHESLNFIILQIKFFHILKLILNFLKCRKTGHI
jgi:hypothetical protein